MQDGRTDTRISTPSLPASRHDCPQYSCPFAYIAKTWNVRTLFRHSIRH
jgi:hypothetical protein